MKKIFILTALLGGWLGGMPLAGATTAGEAALSSLDANLLEARLLPHHVATGQGKTSPTETSSVETNLRPSDSPETPPALSQGPAACFAGFPEAIPARPANPQAADTLVARPSGAQATDTLVAPAPEGPLVTIRTTLGTLKLRLYADVPGHTKAFLARARSGAFNGTLFTRVIREFMIQGGAPDSKNAPAGARCGFGDASAEIPPELKAEHFHKRGALAAPRQNDDINPERKSDMSQFFIVQGKVYRPGELDTLERIQNQSIRKKALDLYYRPVRVEMQMLKHDNPREFNKRVAVINHKIDSMIRATPGHLIFTPEQREAYTTVGGCHFLDGTYTVFGELVEGFDVLDAIASQPKDRYDRPLKDVRILGVE